MMINSIIMDGLKNVYSRTTETLSGLDAFLGSNGAGKTTRMQAIMVAVQGFWKESHGKQPNAVMELANKDKMTVGVVAGDHRYERVFERKGTRSPTRQVMIDGEERPYQEGDGIIRAELGDFPVMFDLGLFTGLTPDKKKQFLFRISDRLGRIDNQDRFILTLVYELLSEISDGDAAAHLLKFKYGVESIDNLSSECFAEFQEILTADLSFPQKEELEILVEEFRVKFSPDAHVLFDVLGKVVSDESAYLKRSIKDTEATKRKLAEASAETDGKRREAGELRKMIADLEKSEESKAAEAAANEHKAKRIEDHEERLSGLRGKIEADEKFLDENEDLVERAERLERVRADMEPLLKSLATEKERQKGFSASVTDLSEQITALRSNVKVRQDVLDRLDKADGKCVVTSVISLPCNQNMTESREIVRNEIEDLNARIEPLEKDRGEASAAESKCAAKVKEIESQVESARTNISDEQREVDKLMTRREEIGKTLDANRAELKTLEKKKLSEPLDQTILDGELQALRDQLKSLRDTLILREKEETMIETLASTVLKGEQAILKMDVVKAAKVAITAMRNRLMSEVTKPLVESMNGLLRKVDPTFSVRFDMEKKFDIIVQRGDRKIPFSGLSGGEHILFAIAMLVAIVKTANPPLKILCLECAELDRERFAIALDAIPKIAQDVDNVLVAYPHTDMEIPDGWSRHDLRG